MIKFTTGDILKSDADALVNTVNCEGYMGKGIAYQFKLAYPQNNKDYEVSCKNGELTVGQLHHFYENNKLIINFPTKNKWREKSHMSYIRNGLNELVKLISEEGVSSIAIPPLGCGNGGLNWDEVKNIIINALEPYSPNIDIIIYEPSQYFKAVSKIAPKLNTSHLIVMGFKPYLKKFTKLSVQKVAFFMNIFSGEDYFKFKKHKYGPYSHSIDIIIKSIKEYQNFYGLDTEKAYDLAKNTLISKKVENKIEYYSPYIRKSIEFINSFTLQKEVELAATVCLIIKDKKTVNKADIIMEISNWSEEKSKKFSNEDIDESLNILVANRIIDQDLLGQYSLSKVYMN